MASILSLAIDKLSIEFQNLDLTFHEYTEGSHKGVTSYFPGTEDEDIMVCVFKGNNIHEPFHRQDFFFLNYAYTNSYDALSAKYDNKITVHENECYIGQPYSGYALRGDSGEDIVIVGILIRKEAFFKEYLPALSSDSALFHFLLEPQTNRFSDEFIHLSFTKNHPVRRLLEMMILEYADRKEDTQNILKPLLLTLLMHIARRYRLENANNDELTLTQQLMQYIGDHIDTVSLSELSAHFAYHPNYISSMLHKEGGKTFTKILLEKRMERAVILMRNTTLSIEEIAAMVGYANHSNFYKAFKEYFGVSPREYLNS